MNSIIAKYREIKEDNPLRIAYSKRKENMVTNYNTDTLNDCPKSTFRTVWGGACPKNAPSGASTPSRVAQKADRALNCGLFGQPGGGGEIPADD